MDTLLYIEQYFAGEPSEDLKKEFEKRIQEDAGFAEEVSIYLSARQVIAEETKKKRKERFGDIYAEYKKINKIAPPPSKGIVRRFRPFIAAAAILIAAIVGWVIFSNSGSPEQLADKYIKENFQRLGVTMGSKEDSLQAGARLYNEGKLPEALGHFESIINRDSSSFQAIKYAGIVSLMMNQYDKALKYFEILGNDTQLYSNPGKFYAALTLLKRNQPGDKLQGKKLLEEVVKMDGDEKETAIRLLNKW